MSVNVIAQLEIIFSTFLNDIIVYRGDVLWTLLTRITLHYPLKVNFQRRADRDLVILSR